MKKLLTLSALAIASSFLAGCAHTAQPYNASFDNLNRLKMISSKHPAKIRLGQFTSMNPKASIMCRLDESESLPNGMTYVQYIKHALQGELTYSNILSPDAHVVLSARLNNVDFSSMGGTWSINMTFDSNVGGPFTVRSTYHFASAFNADSACARASEAFVPAVQQFLRKVYATPNFQRLLKHR